MKIKTLGNALQKLVGCRYPNLELLQNDIELLTKRNLKSIMESERFEDCDFMIDFCFKDNAGQYLITEV